MANGVVPPVSVFLAKRLFDTIDASAPGAGDLLFNIFGVGNTPGFPDRPFERFCWYEELLMALQAHNPEKYALVHKGTAFYFLSWLSFDLRKYDSALFYMDAAIAEDLRRAPDCWLTEPAGSFLRLVDPQLQVAGSHVARIRAALTSQLARFNPSAGLALTLDDVVSRFVTLLTTEPEQRTVVSAWYLHLLEFEERLTQLNLRSSGGGSIAPFLDYLFLGGLLLESLLKLAYPSVQGNTLGAVFSDTAFQSDFGKGFRTSAVALADIVAGLGTDFVKDAFETSAKLRNTTGHNLVWDDAFRTPSVFQRLAEHEVNAVLLVIARKF